jgi:hypothetical protein
LFSSSPVSTHAPLQSVSIPQSAAHTPALQTSPEGHMTVQAPQLSGSLVVSVQVPPQSACPKGHEQTPPEHVAPAPHGASHAPQWLVSVWVSTQAALHSTSAPQSVAQVPR